MFKQAIGSYPATPVGEKDGRAIASTYSRYPCTCRVGHGDEMRRSGISTTKMRRDQQCLGDVYDGGTCGQYDNPSVPIGKIAW
jgi:hypothetical protein